jgi:hypothetical protein
MARFGVFSFSLQHILHFLHFFLNLRDDISGT